MSTSFGVLALQDPFGWPVVFFLLGALFLILFRKEIRARLGKAELPESTEATFRHGRAVIDSGSQELREAWRSGGTAAGSFGTDIEIDEKERESIRWSKTSDLFWLGHDLMWTVDVVLRGAYGETIAQGLQRALRHVRELGLGGTEIEIRLQRAEADAENSREMDWTPLQRTVLTRDLKLIIDSIGELAGTRQGRDDPDPKD